MYHKDCIDIEVKKGSFIDEFKLSDEYSKELKIRESYINKFIYRTVKINTKLLNLGVDSEHIISKYWFSNI